MKQGLLTCLGFLVWLHGAGAFAGPTPTAMLTVTPWNMGETMDFGNVAVGAVSPPQGTTLTAHTTSGGQAQLMNIQVVGSGDFDLTLGGGNCGVGDTLNDLEQCSFPTAFSPSTPGTHTGTLRVTCQVFSAATAASVVCNNVEQTIVSLLGAGFTVSKVPALGQWGVALLGLSIFGLALTQLRRRA